MKEFSEAFNCPAGRGMNPEKKCKIWWNKGIANPTYIIYLISMLEKAAENVFKTIVITVHKHSVSGRVQTLL